MPQEIEDLLQVVADIEVTAEEMTELRRRRAAIVAALLADGWTYQRIADAVGRSKQTINQWARP